MLFGRAVTANLFSILGVSPILGRTFTEVEDQAGTPLVVISYALWQRRFGGDPGLLGRSIAMNGQSTTVIGIMPQAFTLPGRVLDFWMPSGFKPAELARRGSHYLNVIARLKPGVSVEQAQLEMTGIARRLARQYPENRKIGAVVVPVKDQIVGNTRTALYVLLGAAGCVLLIACANLANLLLAKASGRRREMAVRAAMGAGRGRLIRQLITESVLLSLAGGALGIALANWGTLALKQLIPQAMPVTPSLNATVLLFAIGMTLTTGVAFGLAPALRLSRLDLNDVLKQGGRAGLGGRTTLLRDALVVCEVALALMLLIGAGLLVQTLVRLRAVDPGFQTENLLTMQTVLPRPKYADGGKRQAYFDAVLDRIRQLPGVRGAAFVSDLPYTTTGDTSGFRVEGRITEDQQDCLLREGTRDYLETLGVHLIEGRLFSGDDRSGSLGVAIVNETFAKYVWAGQSALGKRIQVDETGPKGRWYSVVGVVRDVRERGLKVDLKPGVYMLIDQVPEMWAVPNSLVIRTAANPTSLVSGARQAVWSVDREQPVNNISTMDEIIDKEVASHRQEMTLLSAFAVLALVLSSLGIYGVLSYLVSQRTREMGLRMALGARPGELVRMMVIQGTRLAAIGLAIGLLAAVWLAKLMASLVYGIGTTDPIIYASMAAVLGIVSAIACVAPALKAARVDPVVALREE